MHTILFVKYVLTGAMASRDSGLSTTSVTSVLQDILLGVERSLQWANQLKKDAVCIQYNLYLSIQRVLNGAPQNPQSRVPQILQRAAGGCEFITLIKQTICIQIKQLTIRTAEITLQLTKEGAKGLLANVTLFQYSVCLWLFYLTFVNASL